MINFGSAFHNPHNIYMTSEVRWMKYVLCILINNLKITSQILRISCMQVLQVSFVTLTQPLSPLLELYSCSLLVQLVGSTPFEVFDWDYIHCSDTGAKFFLLILLDENERAKLNICSSMRNLSRPRAGQTFIWLKTLGYQLQVL